MDRGLANGFMQVQCILGCRVAASHDAPSSRHITEVGKDGQLKDAREGGISGSEADVSEGPGDAAGMEWKVVKRVPHLAGMSEPMEIDSPSGADAGHAVVKTKRKSPDLMKEQPGNKLGMPVRERFPEGTSERVTTKDETNTTRSLTSNGTITAVEDSTPFVIEIGGHSHMNANVGKSPLDVIAKTDGNLLNKELASVGLSNSVAQEAEELTTKTKEIQNKSSTVVKDAVVLGTLQKEGNNTEPGDRSTNFHGGGGELLCRFGGEQQQQWEFFVKFLFSTCSATGSDASCGERRALCRQLVRCLP